ncbi:hypothetical protein AB50_4981, partial [Escherichia coli 6-175-07_S1_C2]
MVREVSSRLGTEQPIVTAECIRLQDTPEGTK